ncbi:MAG: FAD-dependent oxidoreductase [Actinomycetes bacterium]
MSSRAPDLVVLGAGPAGLAAAWRAARNGLAVTLLERGHRVGGMAGSIEVAGQSVDLGSHRLHPATPGRLLADLSDLLGRDLQTRPRRGRLRVADRWVGFPVQAVELARTLPRPLLAGIAKDAALAPVRRPREDSFAEVLRSGLGPSIYDAVYAPYAQKLWGLPGERIAGEQARRRVTADTPWKLAGRMVRRPARRQKGQGRVFHYPRRGFGQLTEALAAAAAGAGVDIRLGTEVDSVHLSGGTVQVGTTGGDEWEAGHAFSTLPLPVLARVTSPGPSLASVESAARLKFRAMVLVYVVHSGGRWSPYDAHYLPGPETAVTRVSEPANYRESADDPADRSVLCAEIPCAVGDGVWSLGDGALAELVGEGLARAGLPPVKIAGVHVERLPHVYPVYEMGFERHLAGLDGWASSLPSVTTFGRLGLFAHDNTHHALVMAYDAVDALGRDGFDRSAWTAARLRFSQHVVED